ncbi:MAG: hypothetical protein ABI680_04080 [Chthoniobacteraceae bacterium]
MIAGVGAPFVDSVKRFAHTLPYAAEFLQATDRFSAQIVTDAYLFKVDWRKEAGERLSLYYRFIHGVEIDSLEKAFAQAGPAWWQGASAREIGEALGLGTPVIVGLRVDKTGAFKSSIYFRYFNIGDGDFVNRVLKPFVKVLDWPPELPRAIEDAILPLMGDGFHASIGVDSASSTDPPTLKIAASDVSWLQAATALAQQGVPSARLRELSVVGRHFRQPRLNYAAMKFGPSGYQGWKAYWAVLGRDRPSGGPTRIESK